MFVRSRRSRRKSNRNIILATLAVVIMIGLFLVIRTKIFSSNNIVSLFISPTPTASPTLSPTPSLTPTSIPTLTPSPTITPTPSPTLTPTSLPPTSFESYFDEYSTQYQISKDLLKKIAFCESGMNPRATNGPYGGMYQFTVETWKSTRAQMGRDTNPDLRFDAKEAIETAAFKIANKGERAWINCL